MFIIEKIKKLLKSSNRKKLIENAAILTIIGVILLIAGKSFLGSEYGKNDKSELNQNTSAQREDGLYEKANNEMEGRLKSILSQVYGAGKVDVMVSYSVSKEKIPVSDVKKSESITDEKDSGGGTRKISQSSYESSIVFENGQNGEKSAMIVKELEPEVKGVLVVAEGAGSPAVKDKLCRAVQVLLDIPIHKIQVVEGRK